ncbi:Rv2629 family ribosome hibernation factor [Mycolicibacterium arenosum]|uniref:Peptide chain release factor 1 n=1 Tax=Mycolicibacterium arenosum TaxID=2952157 RepID=A0ABT1M9Y4_9MYCO|nr:hypothetical protein [Mycolicibacterium sp. CAU 1645]MCP9275973.1 hypothetical protein [Mycolicibacterium sp. CAU 1645]
MNVENLRQLTSATGPFASVYLDDSRDSSDAVLRFETTWHAVRARLVDLGANDDLVTEVENAMLNNPPAVGRRGRVVIATADGVLIDEHVPNVPPAPEVRVSDYPYILPLTTIGVARPPYTFAAVDERGADLTTHQNGIARSESVEGEGFPVHKPATAGWNGYGDLQHTAEEAVRMNVRAVADRLTSVIDGSNAEVVFVAGAVRPRHDVVAALPVRAAERVVQLHGGAEGHRVREAEITELLDAEFDRFAHTETTRLIERYTEEQASASGLAVEGMFAVCGALRAGNVDTLIVVDLDDAMVVMGKGPRTIAPHAGALVQAVVGVGRADEVLPMAALAVDATVVTLRSGLSPRDGVAALLRYFPGGG